MIKRFLLIGLLILSAAFLAKAQQTDYLQQLESHPEFLAGTDYLCPTGAVDLTPAPKGYKAFYISHYGRHGARYAWQSDMYERLRTVFSTAAEQGNLTSLGQSFKERFDSLYPEVRYRVGDLSRKGWEQQQELAERMYKNFPEVFKGEATVRSWVSTSTRCVMTMSSFCLGLKGMNPKLDIFENFGYSFLPAILPLDSKNPFRVKEVPMTPLRFSETWEEYVERTVNYRAILARLFNDPKATVEEKDQWSLVSYLYFFAAGMNSLDTNLDFTDIFSHDERIDLWKADDFQFYAYAWPTHEGYMPIVNDIIEKADARIIAGQRGADLRFGHDYQLLAFSSRLGVKGIGERMTKEEAANWPGWLYTPFAGNLQMIFYKNKSGDVIVKCFINERETTLIGLPDGPYYPWEDVKGMFKELEP